MLALSKITVHPRHARGFAGAVRELETSSAELSDERLPGSPTLWETGRTSSASSERQYQ